MHAFGVALFHNYSLALHLGMYRGVRENRTIDVINRIERTLDTGHRLSTSLFDTNMRSFHSLFTRRMREQLLPSVPNSVDTQIYP